MTAEPWAALKNDVRLCLNEVLRDGSPSVTLLQLLSKANSRDSRFYFWVLRRPKRTYLCLRSNVRHVNPDFANPCHIVEYEDPDGEIEVLKDYDGLEGTGFKARHTIPMYAEVEEAPSFYEHLLAEVLV